MQDLPSSSLIDGLRAKIIAAAQARYDAWAQDEDGQDVELGSGGICHLIAEDVGGILNEAGFDAFTQCSTAEQHVYCVVGCSDGIVEVDIPWRLYERGGGFCWTKLKGVIFALDDVAVSLLDRDPANIRLYVEADFDEPVEREWALEL